MNKIFQLLLLFLNIAVGGVCVCHYKYLLHKQIQVDSLVGIDVRDMIKQYGAPIEISFDNCTGNDKSTPIIHCTYEFGVKDGYVHFMIVDICHGKVSFAVRGSRKEKSRGL